MVEKRSSKANLFTGITLIILGIVFALIQYSNLRWDNFWPLILVAGGILFFTRFLMDRSNYSSLMPGSILLIIGILFFYLTLTSWSKMEYLWPTFILAPGIGFLLIYIFNPEKNNSWVAAVILILLAIVFYAQFFTKSEIWPIFLIIIGLYLIIKQLIEDRKEDEKAR
jgi:uncharacterized membrane protein HdeD (DUF308 family)